MSERKIIFACGGTAGHIEPALAVANAWQRLYLNDDILFIGTDAGLEKALVPARGFKLQTINKVVAPRSLSLSTLTFPFRLRKAVAQSKREIAGATVVIGFGGYVSAPVYRAAAALKIPVVIHEANATVGWANRYGARFASQVCVARAVDARAPKAFREGEIVGMPLREDVLSAAEYAAPNWLSAREEARKRLGFDAQQPLIAVVGGSQGSQALNREISGIVSQLLQRGVQVIHSLGGSNQLPESRPGYQPVHYIEAMADVYLAADLVIARSGAVTCAEFATLGRYALFIPLPIGNGEQMKNAQFLVQAGRAEIITQGEFSGHWLMAHLNTLLDRSKAVGVAGSTSDLTAAKRIVAIMESAIRSGGR
jgi:UDP-N-acetylglucosamine--N-acetylmuramyl-(pentapeptide) pyrophosphoryl-undecaprenol N-acetylglucosamine transferase